MPEKPFKLTITQKTIISLGCAAPLIGSYYIIPRYTLPFDFYDHYFIFIIIHLYNIFNHQKSSSILPVWLLKGLSILVLTTLIASFDNPTAFNFAFAKQFFGSIFSASSYYLVFKLARFDIIYLFRKYVLFAFWASFLAIIEEILHLFGTHVKPVFMGSLGLYRVGALSGEPYNLSLALFPAMFFYLLNLISDVKQAHESKRICWIKSSVIFLAFFLTFSSTGFIGLFISFIVIAIHKGYFNIRRPRILIAPIFFAGVYVLFSYLTSTDENLNRKVSEGIWFLKGEEKETFELSGLNSSSFALLSNYYITMEGFKENPIAGIGLGNYETLYNSKFGSLFGTRFAIMYGKSNYNDANSMFLRLLAETGVIGISVFIIYMLAFLIKSSYRKNTFKFYLVAINHGIFVLFLIRLLRCGNYLSDGMFFFILLFYYSHYYFIKIKNESPLVDRPQLVL